MDQKPLPRQARVLGLDDARTWSVAEPSLERATGATLGFPRL
jgi:hypothetical protein